MPKKLALSEQAASFIERMDCLPVSKVPEGPEWIYEIKLDGNRLEVVRSPARTTLYSRRQNVFNQKFHYVATALINRLSSDLPDETVIDGELVALGPDGRPAFNLLQNFRPAESRIVYFSAEHEHKQKRRPALDDGKTREMYPSMETHSRLSFGY
jgi:ATP-dependent DNA ligase